MFAYSTLLLTGTSPPQPDHSTVPKVTNVTLEVLSCVAREAGQGRTESVSTSTLVLLWMAAAQVRRGCTSSSQAWLLASRSSCSSCLPAAAPKGESWKLEAWLAKVARTAHQPVHKPKMRTEDPGGPAAAAAADPHPQGNISLSAVVNAFCNARPKSRFTRAPGLWVEELLLVHIIQRRLYVRSTRQLRAKLCYAPGGFWGRFKGLMQQLSDVVQRYPIHDALFGMFLSDGDGVPFALSLNRRVGGPKMQDKVFLMPSYSHDRAGPAQVLRQQSRPTVFADWLQKRLSLAWHGSCTGPKASSKIFMHNTRAKFSILVQQYPDLFSGGITDTRLAECNSSLSQIFPMASYTGREHDLLTHRHVLDLDGNAWSERFPSLLSAGKAAVFKSTKFEVWFDHLLTPWRHYIPLDPELADVAQKLHWAHRHPEETLRIAQRGASAVQPYGQRGCDTDTQLRNLAKQLRILA